MEDSYFRFAGFPANRLDFTPLPSAFFSRLLPHIDDLAELKVTLHLFWLLHRKKGEARFARWEELIADRTLTAGLGASAATVEEIVGQALEKAIARGTVLNVALESPSGVEQLYFLNTGEGRRAVSRLRRGEMSPPAPHRAAPDGALLARSPLARLYEQQISLLTPDLAAELARAEVLYGTPAVAEAVAEAVRYEKRRWSYVKRVLENRQPTKGGQQDNGQED